MWRSVAPSKQGMLALLILLIGIVGTACTRGEQPQHPVTRTPTALAGQVSLTPPPPAASVAYVTGFTPSTTEPTTYFVAALNIADGSVRWRYTSAPLIRDMVAVGDVVLFERDAAQGTNPQLNTLVALNASDGRVRWTHVTANLSTFTAQGTAVYISGANTPTASTTGSSGSATSGLITSLDIRSGAIRWRKTLAAGGGRPIIVGSLLYDYIVSGPTAAPGPTSEIIALDSNTGKQQWVYTDGNYLAMPEGETGPLVIGNRVYTLSVYNLQSGRPLDDLVALDARSGAVRWRSTIGGRVLGLGTGGSAIYLSAALFSPSGALQSPGYEVEALRANDGQTLWKTSLTYVPSAPTLGDSKVFITATGALNEKSPVDMALALSAADGSALWRIPGTVAYLSGDNPTTDGALVYVVTYLLSAQVSAATPFPANTEVSLIKAIRIADGQPRWETPLSVGFYPRSPVVSNGKVFVTFTGYRPDLAVLDAASGSILWRFGSPSSEIIGVALPA